MLYKLTCSFLLLCTGCNLSSATQIPTSTPIVPITVTTENQDLGILAVPSGQREAATASGLSPYQQLRYIILPQAMRPILPPLVGQYVLLVKDSSVVSAIGVVDITRVGWLTVQRIPEGIMVFGLVGILYFVICYPLINLSNYLERRMSVVSTRL